MVAAAGVALSLAKYIPDFIGLFSSKRGKQAKEAMDAVEKVAESVTGKKGDDAVRAIEADPELAFKFKTAVMADSHISDQMEMDDRERASGQYKVHHEQADKIAQSIMSRNLPTILALVVTNVISVYTAEYFKLPTGVLAIISNLIGVVIGQLLAERQSVVGFFFGSSVGSKTKDK